MRLQLSVSEPRLDRVRALLCALTLAIAWLGFGAGAAGQDAATGQWGGTVEGRGNYYWERSTRVIVPEVKATIDTPNGIRIGAGYLMDAISSASIASGNASDQVGTELRHAVTGDVGKEFDLGNSQLDLTLLGTYSTESDYRSLMYGMITSLWIDEKNWKFSLGVTHNQDQIYDNGDPSFHGHLYGTNFAPAIERLINSTLVLTLQYQFGFLEGYLGNHYRNGKIPAREQPPDQRLRHGVSTRLAWYLPATNTAFHFILGGYADSWHMLAIAPEIRIYQQFGPNFLVRPRYRFYDQSAAYFIPPPGGYARSYTGPTTSDPKLFAMQTHTLGLSLEYRMAFLAHTVFDFARDAWLDIAFDRFWSTTSFGNGVIGTAGGRLTF